MKPFKRVYRIGRVPVWEGKMAGYYVCAEYREGGELSITAVEGPKSNGDCIGSCGQASDGLTAEGLELGEGWSKASVARLAEIWEAWHLNHMRAYDSAMRADDWHEKARLEMRGYHFTLEPDLSAKQRKIKADAMASLERGDSVQLSPEDQAALILPYQRTLWLYADENEPAAPLGYERKRDILKRGYRDGFEPVEHKTLGWLKESEHPDGLLSRVHPESGNAYGAKWYREEVPESVLAELQAFPAYIGGLSWFDWHGAAEESAMASAYGEAEAYALPPHEKRAAMVAYRSGKAGEPCGYPDGTPSAAIWQAGAAARDKESS